MKEIGSLINTSSFQTSCFLNDRTIELETFQSVIAKLVYSHHLFLILPRKK